MSYWKEQMEHEPTKGYYEAVKKYFKVKGKDVLEIGTQYGISARAFLENGANLDTVDPNDYPQMKEILKDFDYNFHKMRADEFFAQNKKKYDFIFIDGDHHYKTTKSDINNAFRDIKKGGKIVIHDFYHNHNFHYKEKKCSANYGYGITQACLEILKERNIGAEIKPPYPGFFIININ